MFTLEMTPVSRAFSTIALLILLAGCSSDDISSLGDRIFDKALMSRF